MTTDNEMRELAEKASDGPWESWLNGWSEIAVEAPTPPTETDAAFIAAAREWIPDAVDRLETANENIELYKARWREAVSQNDQLQEQIGKVLDIFSVHLQAEECRRSRQSGNLGCVCEICRAADVLKGES